VQYARPATGGRVEFVAALAAVWRFRGGFGFRDVYVPPSCRLRFGRATSRVRKLFSGLPLQTENLTRIIGEMRKASNIAPLPRLSMTAAEAAETVGLPTADEFRSEFVSTGFVKRLRDTRAELYSVADVTRAVALLSSAPPTSRDEAFLAAEALRRVS
jgi:hypothetical protein